MSPSITRYALSSLVALAGLCGYGESAAPTQGVRGLTHLTQYRWDVILDTIRSDANLEDTDTANNVCVSLWSVVNSAEDNCSGDIVQANCDFFCREDELCVQGIESSTSNPDFVFNDLQTRRDVDFVAISIDGDDALFLDTVRLDPEGSNNGFSGRDWNTAVGMSVDPTDNDDKWGDIVTNRGRLYQAMILGKDPSKFTGVTSEELAASFAPNPFVYLLLKIQWMP
mmetsp:Transcript_5342/g.8436  ORF Transcript_5342/g.8436 Transcript_5342/m.8436 type:complete len:226 (-) Transcript_5342:200-877(-)|eukprot:CAMPEP_0178762468 /NCGR_PEP_ID=MMETSP0744-20121128/16554_1 /TAXON_ID=913974 /ORGANISM="Nitzschia punctata, Strain CCMP561" /LENGTH=225 /DNA_ID=CAMNT_0020417139 /DNA_START=198 /DNA_END=875 /DNA_ORIENTATION=-